MESLLPTADYLKKGKKPIPNCSKRVFSSQQPSRYATMTNLRQFWQIIWACCSFLIQWISCLSVNPLQGIANTCNKGSPYFAQFEEALKSVAAGLRFIFVPILDSQHWILCTMDLQNEKIIHYNSLKIKESHRTAFSKLLSTVTGILRPIFPNKKWGKPIEADLPQQDG